MKSKLQDYCRRLSRHSLFSKKVSFTNKRYTHFGVCVRFAYLEIEGVPNQLRLPELTKFLEGYVNFSSTSNSAKRLKAAVELLDEAFPKKARALRNRSAMLAFLRVAARFADKKPSKEIIASIGRLIAGFDQALRREIERGSDATDADLLKFQETITSNLTSGAVIRERERVLWKKLLLAEPQLAEILGNEPEILAPLKQEAVRAADAAVKLVHAINEGYVGDGIDLFKLTNKTTRALARLGEPLESVERFGVLIDDLYFLLYEGSGDCKRLPDGIPDFVARIRLMRTELRHDIDHGKTAKVKKKKSEAVTAFSRSIGFPSPDVAPAESWPAIHARLLNELESCLKEVRDSLAGAPH